MGKNRLILITAYGGCIGLLFGWAESAFGGFDGTLKDLSPGAILLKVSPLPLTGVLVGLLFGFAIAKLMALEIQYWEKNYSLYGDSCTYLAGQGGGSRPIQITFSISFVLIMTLASCSAFIVLMILYDSNGFMMLPERIESNLIRWCWLPGAIPPLWWALRQVRNEGLATAANNAIKGASDDADGMKRMGRKGWIGRYYFPRTRGKTGGENWSNPLVAIILGGLYGALVGCVYELFKTSIYNYVVLGEFHLSPLMPLITSGFYPGALVGAGAGCFAQLLWTRELKLKRENFLSDSKERMKAIQRGGNANPGTSGILADIFRSVILMCILMGFALVAPIYIIWDIRDAGANVTILELVKWCWLPGALIGAFLTMGHARSARLASVAKAIEARQAALREITSYIDSQMNSQQRTGAYAENIIAFTQRKRNRDELEAYVSEGLKRYETNIYGDLIALLTMRDFKQAVHVLQLMSMSKNHLPEYELAASRLKNPKLILDEMRKNGLHKQSRFYKEIAAGVNQK